MTHLPGFLFLLPLMIALLALSAPLTAQSDNTAKVREILKQEEYQRFRLKNDGKQSRQRTSSDGRDTSSRPSDSNGTESRWTGEGSSDTSSSDYGRSSSAQSVSGSSAAVIEWLVRIVAFLLAAALLGGLVYAIVGAFRNRERKIKSETEPTEREKEIERAVKEKPSDVRLDINLLRDALEQALRQGDFSRAAHLRFCILWHEIGLAEAAKSLEHLTWRGLARRVETPSLRRGIMQVLRTVEDVRFGGISINQQHYQSWASGVDDVRLSRGGV